jgi:hypothetical protein
MSGKKILDDFRAAIHSRKKILIRFYSKEDKCVLQRICAPLDFGPSRHAKQKNNRYHSWDFTSDKKRHVLSLNPEQIISIEVLHETFEPAEFITWDTKKSKWSIQRDWGKYS